MPDANGKLTKEEFQAAVDWVNTKWLASVPCELCGTRNNWSLGEYVVAPPNVVSGVRLPGGFHYPSVPVFCSTCGNTKYMNAFISGVVKR